MQIKKIIKKRTEIEKMKQKVKNQHYHRNVLNKININKEK